MIFNHFIIYKVTLFSPPIELIPQPAITTRIVSTLKMKCFNYANRSPIFRNLVSNREQYYQRQRNMEQTNKIRSTVSLKEPSIQATSLLADYEPDFDMDFVKRLLGRQKKGSLTRSTRNRLNQMHEKVYRLLNPRVIWGVFPVAAIEKNQIEFV